MDNENEYEYGSATHTDVGSNLSIYKYINTEIGVPNLNNSSPIPFCKIKPTTLEGETDGLRMMQNSTGELFTHMLKDSHRDGGSTEAIVVYIEA